MSVQHIVLAMQELTVDVAGFGPVRGVRTPPPSLDDGTQVASVA